MCSLPMSTLPEQQKAVEKPQPPAKQETLAAALKIALKKFDRDLFKHQAIDAHIELVDRLFLEDDGLLL